MQDWLDFILKTEFPRWEVAPKTWMEIARIPHYENVVSRLYGFFWDSREAHGLGDLWWRALKSLLDETELGQHKNLVLHEALEVTLEKQTKKGGYIDILLTNDQGAVIIENKVHHWLANDLEDYWNSIEMPEQKKIGVVLSPNALGKLPHSQFVQIRHIDLLDRVIALSGPYLLQAEGKYWVFLEDLYQNMKNQTTQTMQENDWKLYYENRQKIKEAINFNDKAQTAIFSQIERAAAQLSQDLTVPSLRNNRFRYLASKKHSNLMITVSADEFFAGKPYLVLIVELQEGLLQDRERYKQISFNEDEQERMVSEFYTPKKQLWDHFALGAYTVTPEDITQLDYWVVQHLQDSHLWSIFKKIEDFLTQEKNNTKD